MQPHGEAGVRCTDDGVLVVEEIKSTPVARPSHRRQLRLYALCLAASEPGRDVRGRLVLISPADGTTRRVDVPCDPARVRRELDALVKRVVAAAQDAEELRQRRADAAARLAFPYAERRPGQDELETAVGTFGEGIDLPGAALLGAIVVGPSLPPVGFERACMRHHFDRTTGDGFAHAMLFPGMQRVIQAAGRVHRLPTDVGTIILLGKRFATDPYLACLPRSWYSVHPRELVHDEPLLALSEFWSSRAKARVR
ncbi:MAG: hypothetical protein GY711_00100 [bacterium]|nr:hypothetical protein [bacterium]